MNERDISGGEGDLRNLETKVLWGGDRGWSAAEKTKTGDSNEPKLSSKNKPENKTQDMTVCEIMSTV